MRTRTVLILGLTAMLALASMMVLIMTTALDKHSVIRSSNMFRKQQVRFHLHQVCFKYFLNVYTQDNQPKKLRKQDDSSKKETKNHHHISEADTDMLLAPTSLQACAIFQRHKDIRCGADQPLKICGNTSKFPGVPQSLQEIYNTMDISRYIVLACPFSSGGMTHGMRMVIAADVLLAPSVRLLDFAEAELCSCKSCVRKWIFEFSR